MRLFLSNAVTGEDREAVTVRMQKVVSALKSSGHEPYCAMFDSHKDELVVAGDKTAIYEYAFSNVRSADAMVAIVASDKKSEGKAARWENRARKEFPLFMALKCGVL